MEETYKPLKGAIMNIQSKVVNTYYHGFNLELPGRLNDVNWFAWQWDYDTITIANDTDPELVTFCEIVGDTLDVWVDGSRTQCDLEVHTYHSTKFVLIRIPIYAQEEAIYDGPQETEHHVEINK